MAWPVVVILVAIVPLYALLLRAPGHVGDAARLRASRDARASFIAGYLSAMAELDNSKVVPMRPDIRRQWAERAARRVYLDVDGDGR